MIVVAGYIYSLRKNNNYSLKSALHKSVIILWKEDELYLVLKVSCRRTDNLQPGARYNDHQKIYGIMLPLI